MRAGACACVSQRAWCHRQAETFALSSFKRRGNFVVGLDVDALRASPHVDSKRVWC